MMRFMLCGRNYCGSRNGTNRNKVDVINASKVENPVAKLVVNDIDLPLMYIDYKSYSLYNDCGKLMNGENVNNGCNVCNRNVYNNSLVMNRKIFNMHGRMNFRMNNLRSIFGNKRNIKFS